MENEKIQRFGFWHDKKWAGQPGEFELMPEGPYVLHADHLRITNAMRENQAVLAQEVDALKAENERLKAPVTGGEWDQFVEPFDFVDDSGDGPRLMCMEEFNDLIASRAKGQ